MRTSPANFVCTLAEAKPCGTVELAREVLELVRRCPDPGNAVVGLLNHGIAATGPDLDTLFDRLAGRLERQGPMA